jgi:hypothetical protein
VAGIFLCGRNNATGDGAARDSNDTGRAMSATRRSSLELLEEAVESLRRASGGTWAIYLAGAVPFFGAFLLYIDVCTRDTEPPDPLGFSLLIAVLFGIRQFTRARFAGSIFRSLSGSLPEKTGALHAWEVASVNWLAGIVRLPLLIFPATPVIAFFRNVAVLSATEKDMRGIFRKAGSFTGRGSEQLPALLTIVLLAVVVWVNIFSAVAVLPVLFRIFTGIESPITRDEQAFLSGTAAFASGMLAWCVIDVVLTAFYAVRLFRLRSEKTGADLLSGWRRLGAKAVAGVLLAVAAAQSMPGAQDLDQALDKAFSAPEYQWRKPALAGAQDESPVVKWIRGVFRSIGKGFRWLGRKIGDFLRWIFGEDEGESKGAGIAGKMRLISLVVIVALAGLLIAFVIRLRGARSRAASLGGQSPPPPIDLGDLSVMANALPENEWLTMAREWADKGDYRMALRAYFLAQLAFLGSRELLGISRSKTNLDYQGELKRRARAFAGMDALFAANLRSFENAWYGLYPVDAGAVSLFADNLERMRSLAG